MKHAARTVFFLELRVFRIEITLRLLFRIEVIEIPEEFIEPVIGGQMLIVIPQVVLAELASRITLSLHHVRNGWHPVRDAMRVARHTDREQSGAKRLLSEDERKAARGCA